MKNDFKKLVLSVICATIFVFLIAVCFEIHYMQEEIDILETYKQLDILTKVSRL